MNVGARAYQDEQRRWERGHALVGIVTCDPKWIAGHWDDLSPLVRASVGAAIAAGDSNEAGRLLADAFNSIARDEIQANTGVLL